VMSVHDPCYGSARSMGKDATRDSHDAGLLRRALPFVAPHCARLAYILAIALVTAAFGASEPLALKWIFDELGYGRAQVRGLLMDAA
jgi:hypothetical protein